MENTIDELLTKLNACDEARDWAQGKTFVEVYTTCERGDWLCWLFAKTNPEDVQLLTLVKGHQANTVRHLMRDERSRKAVDTAIAFGEERATKEDLRNAARYAYAAAAAACASDADDAAWAAAEAAWEAAWAACIASDAARAAADAADADDARQSNRQLTAEIFRKYISIEKFKI